MMMKTFQDLTLTKGELNKLVCFHIYFTVFHRACFGDPQNVVIVNRLIKEVGSSNPSFQAGLIRGKNLGQFILFHGPRVLPLNISQAY